MLIIFLTMKEELKASKVSSVIEMNACAYQSSCPDVLVKFNQ